MNKTKKIALAITSIVVIVGTGLAIQHNKKPAVDPFNMPSAQDALGTLPSASDLLAASPPKQASSTPSTPAIASTSPQAPKNEAAPATPKLAYQKNNKSTSRQVAIEQFNKGNYYESVVSEVEGFRATLYHDNIGAAIGNGWNVSMQSKSMNQAITQGIGLSMPEAMGLVALSGNKNASSFPSVTITPDQATKAADIMRDKTFLPAAMTGIQSTYWSKLKPNQQAVVTYHVYKTGNLSRWPTLVKLIQQCALTQAQADCKKAADGFTYTYKINGTVKSDTRSQLYMGALFQDPQAYGYLLGSTAAPADFKAVTASNSGMKIDPSKPADPQIDAQDDFGKLKEQYLEKGIPFTETLSEPAKPVQVNRSVGHMSTGWL